MKKPPLYLAASACFYVIMATAIYRGDAMQAAISATAGLLFGLLWYAGNQKPA